MDFNDPERILSEALQEPLHGSVRGRLIAGPTLRPRLTATAPVCSMRWRRISFAHDDLEHALVSEVVGLFALSLA